MQLGSVIQRIRTGPVVTRSATSAPLPSLYPPPSPPSSIFLPPPASVWRVSALNLRSKLIFDDGLVAVESG